MSRILALVLKHFLESLPKFCYNQNLKSAEGYPVKLHPKPRLFYEASTKVNYIAASRQRFSVSSLYVQQGHFGRAYWANRTKGTKQNCIIHRVRYFMFQYLWRNTWLRTLLVIWYGLGRTALLTVFKGSNMYDSSISWLLQLENDSTRCMQRNVFMACTCTKHDARLRTLC